MRSGVTTIGSLKWSLGLSLLIHAAVFGGLTWLGLFHRSAATIDVADNATIELIAATAAFQEETATATQPAVAPPPVPVALPLPPVAPPPEPTLPETTVAKVVAPPTPPTPTSAAAVERVNVAAAVTQPARAPATTTALGDGSSAASGRDATSAEGKPTAKAHPSYLKNPEPIYPVAARRRRQEGMVLLSVRVSSSGQPTSVTLKQTSGYPSLDAAALNAVREWQFEPARIGALAVESEIEVPIQFRMKE